VHDSLRILLCIGALTGLGSEFPSLVDEPAGQVEPTVAVSVDTTVQTLESEYKLAILPLAQVPMDLQKEPMAPAQVPTKKSSRVKAQACPLEVRAIVEADTMADSFAMLSVNDDTRLVHLEQVLNTPAGSFVLGAIHSSGVVLRKGNQKIHCSLVR
jgi:hypothetical protein